MQLNKNNLINDLKNLVSIASYNSEENVANYIIKELKKEKLNPKKDKYGNVILSIGKGDGFLLNAHMDTVDIKGWEKTALNPVIKDGRLYGRGSSDTKSSIATLMEIARKLTNEKLKKRIEFLFSIKEEDSTLEDNGAYLACKYLKVEGGIVLEPSFKEKSIIVGVGCKGIIRFNIIAYGKSCHSGHPVRGVNPIYLVNNLIDEIKNIKVINKEYKIINQIQKLSSIITVTQVKAYEGINVIPSQCELCIDCRLLPEQKGDDLIVEIKRLCDKHLTNGYKMDSYCIDGYFSYDDKVIGLIKNISSQFNYSAEFTIKEGRNDGGIFYNFGNIQTICFGSGESGQGHTIGESILIEGFIDTSEMIYEFVKKKCVD